MLSATLSILYWMSQEGIGALNESDLGQKTSQLGFFKLNSPGEGGNSSLGMTGTCCPTFNGKIHVLGFLGHFHANF